jgi:uncharacterized protein YeaO (DUF488 family)
MAEESEGIQRVQSIKVRNLNPAEKKALRSALWDSTVSDMRTLIMWTVEDPIRFDHFVDRVLDGVSHRLAIREAEYL